MTTKSILLPLMCNLKEPTKQLKKVELINGEYKPIYATIKDDIEFLYLIIGLILKA